MPVPRIQSFRAFLAKRADNPDGTSSVLPAAGLGALYGVSQGYHDQAAAREALQRKLELDAYQHRGRLISRFDAVSKEKGLMPALLGQHNALSTRALSDRRALGPKPPSNLLSMLHDTVRNRRFTQPALWAGLFGAGKLMYDTAAADPQVPQIPWSGGR